MGLLKLLDLTTSPACIDLRAAPSGLVAALLPQLGRGSERRLSADARDGGADTKRPRR